MKKIIPLIALALALFSKPLLAEDVTLASLDWPPYSGEKLADKGFISEIVTKAFESSGMKATILILPWERAVRDAENGTVDAYMPEYFSEELKAKFMLSESMPGGPLGFMKPKGSEISYKSLQDLKGKSVGVVSGYVNTDEFDKADYITKEESPDDASNLTNLAKARIDLAIVDFVVADYLLNNDIKEHSSKIEQIQPPLEFKPLYIAFSKKSKNVEAKVKAFNEGLKKIKEDGTLDKILEKHGVLGKVK